MQIVFTIVAALISYFFALKTHDDWRELNPNKLGFRWGFFVVYSTLITNLVLSGFFVYAGLIDETLGVVIAGIVSLALSVLVFRSAVKRKKWALVASTLLSFNLLWWIINAFYLTNRWQEFNLEQKSAASFQSLRFTNVKESIPKSRRVMIFCAFTWGLAVVSYVLLFEPYGYRIGEDDYVHLAGVLTIPPLAIWLLWEIYERFVR